MSVRTSYLLVPPPVLALALAVCGCLPAEEPAEATVTSALVCSIIVCTENAATAGDGLLFDELDLAGGQNYAGVAMTDAHLGNGHRAQIMIVGDELRAFDLVTSTWNSGDQLWHMIIDFVHVPTTTRFQIRLDAYDAQSVVFMSGVHEPIPVYAFKARRDPTDNFTFDVCSNGTLAPDPSWDGLDHYALVFRGDRYDPGRKRLKNNDPNSGWSFLACNGSAASKVHLWRHTYAGGFDAAGNPTYLTTLDERTALLKAITADYCGTGTPTFTVMGTPLAFATAQEPLSFPSPRMPSDIASIEALWGANGAHCLDHPRREGSGMTKPEVEKRCKRSFDPCAPPGATAPLSGWWNTHYAVTANPCPGC
jgi:hypothetical protein